jgi:MFS family permease
MRQALARRRGAAAPANLLLPVTRGAEFQLLDSIMTVLLVAISCWLLPALALAADGQSSGPSVLIFIAQLIALLFCGRLMGELMQRIGQPAVMGQLIAGVLLGPSVLGALSPQIEYLLFPARPEQKAMIDAVAQLGIVLLLLLDGDRFVGGSQIPQDCLQRLNRRHCRAIFAGCIDR